MHELIPIGKQFFSGSEQNCVNARELHAFLESRQDFSNWIKNRIADYGFIENQDFVLFNNFIENPKGGRPRIEYFISLDMAKELAMVERTEKGKQARQYFIECEKRLHSGSLKEIDFADPIAAAQAFIAAETQRRELQQQNQKLLEQQHANAPKVAFAQAVESSQDVILVRDLAKILKQNGVDIGEHRLFAWFRENRYLTRDNTPTQRSMDLGVFVVSETVVSTPKGNKVRLTPKVTGKGQIYFINKFQKMAVAA